MKSRAICHLLLLLALLFSACSRQQGLRMRQQLHDLQARNQADSLLTDDSLALSLASWFDDHGTANERMLAHYLLARTYHDREEYPQALSAYHNAAACADTMRSDCDFHILCRVHAQMADLFRWQRLYERQIGELQMSYHYAMLDHDTAMILFAYSEQAFAYNVQNQIDSAIAIWKKSIALEREYGYDQYAAMDNGALVLPLVLKGKLEEARRCIDVYERCSGMFDAKGDIRKGSEIYYYTKAMYYLAVSAFDSTAYYLRKEHSDASDLNNRFAVAKGFFLLYERTHRLDSLSKYASLMCELQDSINADKEKEDILKFDRLYKYDRLQHQISKKNQEIRRKKNTIWGLSILSLLLLGIALVIYRTMKRKKEKALQKYIHNLESLEMLQSDVAVLEEDKEKLKASIHTANEENLALSTAISDAQKEIKRLHVRIEKYEKRHGIKAKNELESQFYQQSVYLKLKHIASHPINNVDEKDWTELKQCFNAIVPNFHMWMYDKDYKPNENEYRVCMLTWLQFSPKEISNMIKLSMSYVTLIRKKLLKNMFKIDGTAKEFDIKIRNIH